MELPSTAGQLLNNMALPSKQRHMILLPLTQRAVIQYCTKAIINTLKVSKLNLKISSMASYLTYLQRKLFEPNCPDAILGDLLVLSQLEYPRETSIPESVFSIISSRKQFSYLPFPSYVIVMDFLEEFMHIWVTHNGEYNFEFIAAQQNVGGRRIGTRGADKGVREDFKQIMKQQVSRSNEDLCLLIAEFITKEDAHLLKNIF